MRFSWLIFASALQSFPQCYSCARLIPRVRTFLSRSCQWKNCITWSDSCFVFCLYEDGTLNNIPLRQIVCFSTSAIVGALLSFLCTQGIAARPDQGSYKRALSSAGRLEPEITAFISTSTLDMALASGYSSCCLSFVFSNTLGSTHTTFCTLSISLTLGNTPNELKITGTTADNKGARRPSVRISLLRFRLTFFLSRLHKVFSALTFDNYVTGIQTNTSMLFSFVKDVLHNIYHTYMQGRRNGGALRGHCPICPLKGG